MLEMKGGSMNTQIVYQWEKLLVYAWVNQFARMIGRLFARLPAQHHIHLQNLAAQATVMINAIPGAHRDRPPGEEIGEEERRAWLMIGLTTTHTTQDLLRELSKRTHRHLEEENELVRKVELHFESELNRINGETTAPPGPSPMH